MTKNQATTRDIGCIQYALDILGDRWTGLLLTSLCDGPKTFSDFDKAYLNLSPRTLSQRLEMLQKEGLIAKDAYCERPKRCHYTLTDKGSEIKIILDKMSDWGAKYKTS